MTIKTKVNMTNTTLRMPTQMLESIKGLASIETKRRGSNVTGQQIIREMIAERLRSKHKQS